MYLKRTTNKKNKKREEIVIKIKLNEKVYEKKHTNKNNEDENVYIAL